MLISTVQWSESAICIHISPLFWIPSHLGHHRALSRVPCAIQQVLISYLFYTYQCIYVSPNLPIHLTPPFPPWCPYVCSLHLCLFLPCKQVHLYHFSRFHIYVLIYSICFSLSDLLHSVLTVTRSTMSLQMTQFCSFLWLSNIPLYICTTSSLSVRLSMTFRFLPCPGYCK